MNFDKIMTSLLTVPSTSLRHQRSLVVEHIRLVVERSRLVVERSLLVVERSRNHSSNIFSPSLASVPSTSLRHRSSLVVERSLLVVERSRNHSNEESADILNSILELI